MFIFAQIHIVMGWDLEKLKKVNLANFKELR